MFMSNNKSPGFLGTEEISSVSHLGVMIMSNNKSNRVLGTEEISSVSHLGVMIMSNNKSNRQWLKQVTPQKIVSRLGFHNWKMIQSLLWEERELLKGLMR
jgi:hypothetical protein